MKLKLILWVVTGILTCGVVGLGVSCQACLSLDDDANSFTPQVTLRKSSKHFEECGDKTTKIITEHFLPGELYVETAGETGNSLSSNKDCPGDWVLVLTLRLALRSGAGHVTSAVNRVNRSLWGNFHH